MMLEALRRYATADEVADVIGFLACGASRFVSGQLLRVDGPLADKSEQLNPEDVARRNEHAIADSGVTGANFSARSYH